MKATKIRGSTKGMFLLSSVDSDFVELAASTAVFENFPDFFEPVWFGLSYFTSISSDLLVVCLGYPLVVSKFKFLAAGFFSGAATLISGSLVYLLCVDWAWVPFLSPQPPRDFDGVKDGVCIVLYWAEAKT